MAQWTLTAEQFAAAWFGTGLDRMPFPFRFTSRFPGMHEYHAYQRQFRAELDNPDNDPLRRALAVLSRPEWRIELLGIDHRRGGAEMRAIGCAIRGGAGVVALQNPDVDGGRVRLRRCRGEQLATELIRLLPDPPPGDGSEKTYLLADLATDRPDPFENDPARAIQDRYRRFWNRPCTTRGAVSVFLGPRNSDALRTGRLRWIDAEDGRYCEIPANRALMIRPATSVDITRYLDEAIIRAKARMN
ncbi:ESX secretion-associated protein EspG [Nocardia bovistercoris]|uniref:ESX secretion-associated protein EspG n=1 Tax=Nocardia bovistercoris TaxID=2785916 RepID=A0A931I9W5_9NOCA|nr:ESX secretion-associated protein EspG [Nocardia bovistercoris]MBH0775998.1 ESX secretion-associated protein EspG [Nocardia bovistercoris]